MENETISWMRREFLPQLPLSTHASNLCVIVGILVSAAACGTTKDVTRDPEARTDFIAGKIYHLQRPVFLFKYHKDDPKETPRLADLGFSGTPRDLSEFRMQAANNPQVAGLLIRGDKIRVTKFVESSSPTLGTFFEVFAIVLSGPYAGTIVQLNLITKERHPREAHLDALFLEQE